LFCNTLRQFVEHISDTVTENEAVVTGEFHDSHELLGAGVEKSVGTTPKQRHCLSATVCKPYKTYNSTRV